MNCFKVVNVRIAKKCVLTYPGVAGGLFLVGGVLGGGGGVHREAVHPRPSPPSSLSHPHHTRLIIPRTLRHRREVLLRTLGQRRDSAESSSLHSLRPRRESEGSSSPHSETAQRFSGKFLFRTLWDRAENERQVPLRTLWDRSD
jgi:hypothetical protein